MPINTNQPKKGMTLGKHPSELSDLEYLFALNAEITSSEAFLMLSSSGSNILCSRFKEGYKVVGDPRPIHSLGITFWFLANETEGKSEIAVIKNSFNQDSKDLITGCSDCGKQLILDKPLEEQEQFPTCDYTTFVNADCLQFSIDTPIRSWAKVDDCNVRLYFVQKGQPPRYIDYPDYQKELYAPSGDIGCPHIETPNLDCDRIKIFKDACNPILEYVDVVSGGTNTAGTLQFAIQYADAYGNGITNTFYFTNKIDIWDKSKTIINEGDTNYVVNKSVKLHIEGLNPDFDWFNLIVLKTVKGVTNPFLIETFSNTGSSFDYIYAGIDKNLETDLSLNEILRRNPVYDEAQIIFESNGILGLADLEEPRILNLQPVVNKLNVLWETVELNEGDYANPILANKYTSFLRDEVYPLSIEFFRNNTQRTARFHIPGRSPSGYDLEDVTYLNGELNPDVFSSSACDSPSGDNPRWTVYNTATNLGKACDYNPTENTNTVQVFFTCIKENSTFYQNPVTEVYYTNYNPSGCLSIDEALSNPIIPCDEFPCTPIDSDCLYNINQQYPANPSGSNITDSECIPVITQFSTTVTCNVYSTSGLLPVPGSPSGDSNPFNVSCDTAISIEQYACNSGIVPLASKLNDGEQTWFSFTATSDAQQVNLTSVYNQTDGNNLLVTLYSSITGFCSDIVHVITLSSSNPQFIFENLTVGVKYFFSVEATTAVTPDVNNFFYLCTFAPTPTGQTTTTTPNIGHVECKYTVEYTVTGSNCNALVYEYGNMGYWESTELYPCVPEVWGDLANTPIRHHKFPDCAISPHYKNQAHNPFVPPPVFLSGALYNVRNKIYPIGIRIDVEQVKSLLQEAVDTGLITQEERLSICGYRIFRGNRRGNESIIAKGLINDVWKYVDNVYNTEDEILYPNYNYNPRADDVFNRVNKTAGVVMANLAHNRLIKHPYNEPVDGRDYFNNKYVFHSANTHFNNPGLGNELKLESEFYGMSEGRFTEVINHAEQQYNGVGFARTALALAVAETAAEDMLTLASVTENEGFLGTFFPIKKVIILLGLGMGSGGTIIGHYQEWYDLLTKISPYRNFAWYFTSTGKYTDSTTVSIYTGNPTIGFTPLGNTRRGLNDAQYLSSGILSVKDGITTKKLNNYKRESSVYLNLNYINGDPTSLYSTFNKTYIFDNSRWCPNDRSPGTSNCNIGDLKRPIASYYASIKNYLPSQHGQVDNIDYVDTGYYQQIDWSDIQSTECFPIFGGDTFINRFHYRTQVPLFIQDLVGFPPNSDIQYSELGNIGYPRFFYNTPPEAASNITALLGNIPIKGYDRIDYNFSCEGSTAQGLYEGTHVAGILAVSAAGVAGIILAPAGVLDQKLDQSSPDNPVYITGKIYLYAYGNPGFIGESDYNIDLRYGVNQTFGNFYPNISDMVSWTQPLTQESNIINYDNTYYYNRDYSAQNNRNLGFVLPPNFSQEKEDCKVSHPNRVIYSIQDNDNNDRFDGNLVFLANNYWDFNKAGGKLTNIIGLSNNRVLVLQENAFELHNVYSIAEADIKKIAIGAGSLFNNQLQQYVKASIGYGGSQTTAYTSTKYGTFYVDNKRGEILNCQDIPKNIIKEEDQMWFTQNLPFNITNHFPDYPIDNPLKGAGMSIAYDNQFKKILFTKKDFSPKPEYTNYITYDGTNFLYNDLIIFPEDEAYFCNKSFTIGWSPLTQQFSSFYSYIPDYYNELPNYFQAGNNVGNGSELYNYGLTNKSFGVFNQTFYPFLVDYSLKSKGVNQQLQDISYFGEVRRYQTDNNYGLIHNKTLNYALIYNNSSTSGNLELLLKDKNNLFQWSQYNSGKVGVNKTTILVENVNNKFSFNNFQNISRNNGLPIMEYPCSQPFMKEINPNAVSYQPKFIPNSFYDDWYSIRLGNNKDSLNQYIFRLNLSNTEPIK